MIPLFNKRNCQFALFFQPELGQSSRTQVGGGNLDSSVEEHFQRTLNPWTERPQVPAKTFKSEFRPLWWVAGNGQPSPPLCCLAAKQQLKGFTQGGRIQDVSFAPIGGNKIQACFYLPFGTETGMPLFVVDHVFYAWWFWEKSHMKQSVARNTDNVTWKCETKFTW